MLILLVFTWIYSRSLINNLDKSLPGLSLVPYLLSFSILIIRSSFTGHLVCFYHVAIENNATMNVGISMYLQDSTFNSLLYVPRSEK